MLFVEIAWKSELSSVGASCFFQFFVFLFLPETGITAQAAPPELIIFVFASCYKRYAPPELWLFSTIDSHNGLKKRFPLQFVAGTFFLWSMVNSQWLMING